MSDGGEENEWGDADDGSEEEHDIDWAEVDESQIVAPQVPRPADTEPSIDSLERSRFQPATTINRVNSYELTAQEQEDAKQLEQQYPNVYTKSGCPLCQNMLEDSDEFTQRMNTLLKDCSFHFPPHCVYKRISELHKTLIEDRMMYADISTPFVPWHYLIVRNHFQVLDAFMCYLLGIEHLYVQNHTTVPALVSNEMLDRYVTFSCAIYQGTEHFRRQVSVFRALHEKCLARINPSDAEDFDGLAIEDLKTLKTWIDLGSRIDSQLKAITAGEIKKQIGDTAKFVKR